MKSRREFLTSLPRIGILSAMAIFSGVMIHRWINREKCDRQLACGNCTLSVNCMLPQAENFRAGKVTGNKVKQDDGRR